MELIRILVYSCAKSPSGTNMSSLLPRSTVNAAPKLRNYKPSETQLVFFFKSEEFLFMTCSFSFHGHKRRLLHI